jgi:ankyrin repeat protein
MGISYRIGRRLLTAVLLLSISLTIAQPLSSMPRIQVLCGRGTASLCEAITCGDVKSVDALLEAGASANAPDDSGWSPLMFAVILDESEICELLIRHGASIEPGDGMSPLSSAACGGHAQVVRALLAGGAKVDAPNRRGLTALMGASAMGYPQIVRILIQAGASVNAVDSDGDSACIIIAEYPCREEVMIELLHGGADVNIANAAGDTALHVAARAGTSTMISLLLRHGADAHRRNRAGEEPALGDEFAPEPAPQQVP